MTVPPGVRETAGRIIDIVRDQARRLRYRITKQEADLAVHLRSNEPLCKSLSALIEARLSSRANQPVPGSPTECLEILARDHELRWLLNRIEFLRRSPAVQPAEESGEPPAA